MELVVTLKNREALALLPEQGVAGVAVHLPRNPGAWTWPEITDWQAAIRQRGLRFYLIWDGLLTEGELAGMTAGLAGIARLNPDGVQLRDLALVKEARRLYPQLPLQAAGNWGAYNSPGVRLAESLGFTRVVLEGPVSLTDLALIRRQTTMPLAVTLPPFCQGYASLCLLREYPGGSCEVCCLSQPESVTPKSLLEALETFSGLCQLGVEVVQIRGDLFAPVFLAQVIRLFQSVAEASPMQRPQVLGAVREVLDAFGAGWVRSQPQEQTFPSPPQVARSPARRGASRPEIPGRNRLWLEARDYAEALALSREWREPLVISLTPENYGSFLKDHRRWGPRRLIWRLPKAIREMSLAFYQKALETLGQGGYNRFVAGDWGAVGLIRGVGGQIYGDQTLGVRNSLAVKVAREVQVTRVCLPPGQPVEHWQAMLQASQVTPLAICPVPGGLPREDLRWISEDGKAILAPKIPLDLRDQGAWLKRQGIFPLIVALPHSSVPRGQIPAWLPPARAPLPPGK
jgi:collagenase-like PrtC family protease